MSQGSAFLHGKTNKLAMMFLHKRFNSGASALFGGVSPKIVEGGRS